MDDKGLFDWVRNTLYVPVVCDVLDSFGYRNQAMHHRLRPLHPDNCVIVGRARTFQWTETDYAVEDEDSHQRQPPQPAKPGPGQVRQQGHRRTAQWAIVGQQ